LQIEYTEFNNQYILHEESQVSISEVEIILFADSPLILMEVIYLSWNIDSLENIEFFEDRM
jgi:hypothetical protein